MLTILSEFVKFLTEVVRNSTNLLPFLKRSGPAVIKTAEIYDEMGKIINTRYYDIGRVIIYQAHNGGKDFRPDSLSYLTCIHEDYRSPFHSVKESLQKMSIDKSCIEVLRSIYINKEIIIDRYDLPEGIQRSIYEREKIRRTRLFFLKETKSAFWFISFATDNPITTLKENETDLAIRIAVSKIKQRI